MNLSWAKEWESEYLLSSSSRTTAQIPYMTIIWQTCDISYQPEIRHYPLWSISYSKVSILPSLESTKPVSCLPRTRLILLQVPKYKRKKPPVRVSNFATSFCPKTKTCVRLSQCSHNLVEQETEQSGKRNCWPSGVFLLSGTLNTYRILVMIVPFHISRGLYIRPIFYMKRIWWDLGYPDQSFWHVPKDQGKWVESLDGANPSAALWD